MSKITVVFTRGSGLISGIIKAVTRGPISHVALKGPFNSVFESMAVCDQGDKFPGSWLHHLEKYDNVPGVEMYEVEVEDAKAGEDAVAELIGRPYGYYDLVVSAVNNLTGLTLPGDGAFFNDCSCAATYVLRACKAKVKLPKITADAMDPMDLYRVIKTKGKLVKVNP